MAHQIVINFSGSCRKEQVLFCLSQVRDQIDTVYILDGGHQGNLYGYKGEVIGTWCVKKDT